jgi:hypothetical protein
MNIGKLQLHIQVSQGFTHNSIFQDAAYAVLFSTLALDQVAFVQLLLRTGLSVHHKALQDRDSLGKLYKIVKI